MYYEQARQWGKRDVVLVVLYENTHGEWKSMDSVRLSDSIQAQTVERQELEFRLTPEDRYRLLGASPRTVSGHLASYYSWKEGEQSGAKRLAQIKGHRVFALTARKAYTASEHDALYGEYIVNPSLRAYPRRVKPLMIGMGRSKKAIVIYQTTPPPGKCKDCGKFRRAEWFPDHLDKHDAPLAGGYYDQEDVRCIPPPEDPSILIERELSRLVDDAPLAGYEGYYDQEEVPA